MVARSVSLLAVLASLFALTQCALDDRNLEVHGAKGDPSNPLCQRNPDETSCGICVKRNCCGELIECGESTDCQYYIACTDGCGGDAGCEDLCSVDHPEGSDLFNQSLDCALGSCVDSCS